MADLIEKYNLTGPIDPINPVDPNNQPNPPQKQSEYDFDLLPIKAEPLELNQIKADG